ncbi:MAG: response regulator [Pseudohongiellaceae bacterium]
MPPDNAYQPPAPGPVAALLNDSAFQRALLAEQLQAMGLVLASAEQMDGLWHILETKAPAVVFLELLMFEGNGFMHGRRILDNFNVPCILLSSTGRETDARWADKLGISQTLQRPFTTLDLQNCLSRLGLARQAVSGAG